MAGRQLINNFFSDDFASKFFGNVNETIDIM